MARHGDADSPHQPAQARGRAVAGRSGVLRDPRADRDARARSRVGRQRARPDGAARRGADARPRGAPRPRARAARRGVPAARESSSPASTSGTSRACPRFASCSRARRRGSRPSGRTTPTARRRRRCSTSSRARRRSATSVADRPRPADPPARLPLHPQPVPRGDARGVLRAHAPDLVPRARPRRAARRRDPRAPRDPRGDPRRRRRPRGGRSCGPTSWASSGRCGQSCEASCTACRVSSAAD